MVIQYSNKELCISLMSAVQFFIYMYVRVIIFYSIYTSQFFINFSVVTQKLLNIFRVVTIEFGYSSDHYYFDSSDQVR